MTILLSMLFVLLIYAIPLCLLLMWNNEKPRP